MSKLDKMNAGTDRYVKYVEYKGVDIFIEEEQADEDGNRYSGIIYVGNGGWGDWHEFEGSGLYMSIDDAVEYCKFIIDRDSVTAVQKK